MSGFECDSCGCEAVHSLKETREVFDWKAIFWYDRIARNLRQYHVSPRPQEDAEDLAKRWMSGEIDDAPTFVCIACGEPATKHEVLES
jgi:hypothetical protein